MHWMATSGFLDTPTLVVLTSTSLHVVEDELPKLAHFVHEIETGAPPEVLLHKKGRTIPLAKVSVVQSDEKKKSVTVKWSSLSLTSNHGHDDITIDFPSSAHRDEFFQALREVYAEKSRYSRKEFSKFRAAWGPLTGCVLIVVFAVFIIWAGGQIDDDDYSPHSWKARAFRNILSKIVAVIGLPALKIIVSVIALICLYFAGRDMGERIKNPPIMLTLKPKGWKPPK